MMMTRDEILMRMDELLDTYQPYTADNPPSVKIVVASSNWSSNLPWGDGFDDDKIHQREERACAQPDERAA